MYLVVVLWDLCFLFSEATERNTETRVYDNHCRPFGRCLSIYYILTPTYSYLLADGLQHRITLWLYLVLVNPSVLV
jgi:hypothetical protein